MQSDKYTIYCRNNQREFDFTITSVVMQRLTSSSDCLNFRTAMDAIVSKKEKYELHATQVLFALCLLDRKFFGQGQGWRRGFFCLETCLCTVFHLYFLHRTFDGLDLTGKVLFRLRLLTGNYVK